MMCTPKIWSVSFSVIYSYFGRDQLLRLDGVRKCQPAYEFHDTPKESEIKHTHIRSAMRSGYDFPSKRQLPTHSESWLVFARELALKGNLPTLNLTPAALSSSSFLPTQATSGWV